MKAVYEHTTLPTELIEIVGDYIHGDRSAWRETFFYNPKDELEDAILWADDTVLEGKVVEINYVHGDLLYAYDGSGTTMSQRILNRILAKNASAKVVRRNRQLRNLRRSALKDADDGLAGSLWPV